jgi:small conductance mechanosensitive channel
MQKPLELITDKLSAWYEILIVNLPNFVLGIGVFVLTIWLSQVLKRVIDKRLTQYITKDSIRSLTANVASVFVLIIGLVLALSTMNLDTAIESILAGAGVAGLAVGLALKGALSNLFSGVVLSVKDILNVGDWIETNGYSGQVEEITMRSTFIREKDNNIVVIPNSLVLTNPFKNFGITPSNKLIINCGVHYDTDLRYAKEVLLRMVEDNFPPPSEDKQPQIFFNNFGGSSIDFEMRFWFDPNKQASKMEAKSEAIILIQEYFADADIEIPYPIRTIIHQNNQGVESAASNKEYSEN